MWMVLVNSYTLRGLSEVWPLWIGFQPRPSVRVLGGQFGCLLSLASPVDLWNVVDDYVKRFRLGTKAFFKCPCYGFYQLLFLFNRSSFPHLNRDYRQTISPPSLKTIPLPRFQEKKAFFEHLRRDWCRERAYDAFCSPAIALSNKRHRCNRCSIHLLRRFKQVVLGCNLHNP